MGDILIFSDLINESRAQFKFFVTIQPTKISWLISILMKPICLII